MCPPYCDSVLMRMFLQVITRGKTLVRLMGFGFVGFLREPADFIGRPDVEIRDIFFSMFFEIDCGGLSP